MNFLLVYLWDTLLDGDYPDYEPIRIPLGERTRISGQEIVETVNKEISAGGFGVLGEFLFIESVSSLRGKELTLWNNAKIIKYLPWHLLNRNVQDSHSKVTKRKCEDAPCCGCCDISDDGWNGYLNY